ncbi:MAG: hypothetical protein KGZ63_11515 [Clostridiales bacterium]|nr:hypothetical protein [Clostridiales bacterium]
MIDSCFTCVYAKVYPGRYATYYSPPEPPEAECTLDTEQTGITEELEDILQRNKAKLAEYCMCYQPLPESKYDV